jgi:hypothetical protein
MISALVLLLDANTSGWVYCAKRNRLVWAS